MQNSRGPQNRYRNEMKFFQNRKGDYGFFTEHERPVTLQNSKGVHMYDHTNMMIVSLILVSGTGIHILACWYWYSIYWYAKGGVIEIVSQTVWILIPCHKKIQFKKKTRYAIDPPPHPETKLDSMRLTSSQFEFLPPAQIMFNFYPK